MFSKFITKLSGKSRHTPKVQWSNHSVFHNVFRAYEQLFGRRDGIRPESTKELYKDENDVWHSTIKCYSFESKVVHAEIFFRSYMSSVVRNFLNTAKYWSWKIDRMIPQFGNIPSLFSPAFVFEGISTLPKTETHNKAWVFAIAFDNAIVNNPVTTSFTITGSNTILLSGSEHGGTSDNEATPTYGGVSVTLVSKGANSNVYTYTWYLLAAAQTANYIADPNNAALIAILSYSGVAQNAPEAFTASTGSGTSISVNHTTINANAWIALFEGMNSGGSSTGGTNATERSSGSQQFSIFDTNAPVVTPASTNQQVSVQNSNNWRVVQISFAPFVAVGPSNVKTWDGVTQATGIKTYFDVTLANTKSVDGVS